MNSRSSGRRWLGSPSGGSRASGSPAQVDRGPPGDPRRAGRGRRTRRRQRDRLEPDAPRADLGDRREGELDDGGDRRRQHDAGSLPAVGAVAAGSERCNRGGRGNRERGLGRPGVMTDPAQRRLARLAAVVLVALAARRLHGAGRARRARSASANPPPCRGAVARPGEPPGADPLPGQRIARLARCPTRSSRPRSRTPRSRPAWTRPRSPSISAEPMTWNERGARAAPSPARCTRRRSCPGYQIVLEAGGKQLDYHASESGTIKLCKGLAG